LMNDYECLRRWDPMRLLRYLANLVRGGRGADRGEMLHMAVHLPGSSLLHSAWFDSAPESEPRIQENGSAGSNGLRR
jgi:hypothetical protein